MPAISIFSGAFCNGERVIQDVFDSTGHQLITDDMIVDNASEYSSIPAEKIRQAFSSKASIFNTFTHEKECSIAYLKLTISKLLETQNIIFFGYSGLLIPESICHVLRVCMIAKTSFRISLAMENRQLSEEEARDLITLDDQAKAAWTELLFSKKDPWDPSLYDIVLPMGQIEQNKAFSIIEENLLKDAVRETDTSMSALKDFQLASTIEVALINAGHNVGVQSQNGAIVLTINKQVLMLSRLEKELRDITIKIPGVDSIQIQVNSENNYSNIYRKHDIDIPSKVLLVDDEREFVQTLSERLQLRDMGSVVVFDGKSAMDIVKHDSPEVMIIDLKMPGMDGMQILKEVKQNNPEIEVIVLTGHGSEKDKNECMDLGAFAYMQKPIDINILSDILQKAHKKIKTRKENQF